MTDALASEGGFPALALRLTRMSAAERAAIDEALGKANEQLFNRLGVVAPQIAARTVRGFKRSAVLELDGRELGTIDPGAAAASIAALLEKEAALLVVPGLVEFYLGKLKARAPALVSAARTTFPVPVLVEALRARVRDGKSIRNFAGVLDEMLVESASLRGPEAMAGVRG